MGKCGVNHRCIGLIQVGGGEIDPRRRGSPRECAQRSWRPRRPSNWRLARMGPPSGRRLAESNLILVRVKGAMCIPTKRNAEENVVALQSEAEEGPLAFAAKRHPIWKEH